MGKVLLITGSTGGGHTQVANTLRLELENRGHEVFISDLLVDFNKLVKFTCIDSYTFLYKKIPFLYGMLYRISDSKFISKMINNMFCKLIGKKVLKFIHEINPAIIISVHPFATGILGKLRSEGHIDCFTTAIITEFKVHWTHVGEEIDYYIVSGNYSKKSLVKKEVDSSIISPKGIPIHSSFLENNTEPRNKETFTVLIMGGSDGQMFIKRSLFWIVKNKDIKIITVCGKNDILKKRLENKYKRMNNVEIRGYVNDISSLMSQSDILITKPGAITITEAISQELPIVIPYAIPGHETANAKFLVKSGIAIKTGNYLKLVWIINKMKKNPGVLDFYKVNLKNNEVNYYTPEIIDMIDNII